MSELNAMPMHWYVVKVRQGRERWIARAIAWEFSRHDLADQFGQILVVDKYPGYLLVNMAGSDQAMRLVEETEYVVGLRQAVPLEPKEVVRIVGGRD